MIGGTDVILEVKPGVSAADVIIRVVRRHWPHCLYQNADDEGAPLPVPDATTPPVEPEFFLYQNQDAARSWDEFGATPENQNSMLYVLLPKATDENSGSAEVTVVCGELVGPMAALMTEIEAELSRGAKPTPGNGADSREAAPHGAVVRE